MNPGGGKIFRTHPDRPWTPSSLVYDGYRLSFPGVFRIEDCVLTSYLSRRVFEDGLCPYIFFKYKLRPVLFDR